MTSNEEQGPHVHTIDELCAEIEKLAQRALDAEQGRDRAVAEELRLRTEVDRLRDGLATIARMRGDMAETQSAGFAQDVLDGKESE